MERVALISLVFLTLALPNLSAQDYKPSKTQFMIRGYGNAGFTYKKNNGDLATTFEGSSFAPIFLFKHSDRLLFEAELEFVMEENNTLEIGFEYANVSYVLNKYMIIRAGKFLLPFGTFMEKLHPSWINKFSTKPLGFGHDGIAPSSGIGLELRGAAPVGGAKINYSLYLTNGPALKDGSDEPEEAGMLSFENFIDNNNNKTLGGRIGILPFSNSSVELGFSAYSGKAGNRGDELYENVGAFLYAVDFSFVRQISPLKGVIDIKAQYNQSNVDDANYYEMEPGDSILTAYTFNNASSGLYAQLSYRPSMLNNNFFRNLEVAGRYSSLNTPEGAEWEQEATQIAIGLNYWMSWRSVLKFSYQVTESEGGHDNPQGKTTTTGIFAHWAIGF